MHAARETHHALVVHLLPAALLQPRGPGRRAIPSTLPCFPLAMTSLTAWAQRAVTYGLSLDPLDLLTWWPTAPRAYTAHARALTRCELQHRMAARADINSAQAALDSAMAAVATSPLAQLPTAISAATTARASLRAATHA